MIVFARRSPYRATSRVARRGSMRVARAMAACLAISFYGSVTATYAAQLSVEEIAPGVFVHRGQVAIYSPSVGGDISNCGFVIGREAVAVIDSCGSAPVGRALRDAIRARTDRPIRYVVATHMHPDHILGAGAFAEDRPTYVGHKKLARALAARADRYLAANKELMGAEAFADSRVVPPSLGIEDREEIDLGGRVLELRARPTAHTDNDLTVLDRQTGTLFVGDLLFSVHVPALDGSIRGWLKLLGELKESPAQRVVPGHGPAAMAPDAAIAPVERYLSRVADDVRKAIRAGQTLAAAATSVGVSERDAWLLFDEFHARNVSAAFAELEWE